MRLPVLAVLVIALCLSPRPARAAPHAVAVLYFDNDTGDPQYDPLGKGLADMMLTDLAGVPGIQIVEREKLEAVLAELKLQKSHYFDPKTAAQIGHGIGAEYAITGSFAALTPDIRIDVRVIRIATGEIVKARKVVGPRDKFFELQEQLAAALIEAIGASPPGDLHDTAEANRIDDVDAASDYGRGLDQRDHGDLQGASDTMQKVVAKAPRFKLAKTRQMEILKALYAAKDTRVKALSASEAKLIPLVEKKLAGTRDPIEIMTFRILRGDILLHQIAARAQGPAAEYRGMVADYVRNQDQLIDEAVRFAHARPSQYVLPIEPDCLRCVDRDMGALISDLGLEPPISLRGSTPHEMMEESANWLMFGLAPDGNDGPRVKIDPALCFWKLDPAYGKHAIAWLDRALDVLEEQARADKDRAGSWLQSRVIDVTGNQAIIYLALGKPEEATAKLQGLLTRYPKAQEFEIIEKMLRAIVAGTAAIDGHPLVPSCRDPR